MKKYNESVFDKKEVQEVLKIKLWEKVLLWFIPAVKVENEETISYYKKMGGKFYLISFSLKNL